jgi:hypothetical protein
MSVCEYNKKQERCPSEADEDEEEQEAEVRAVAVVMAREREDALRPLSAEEISRAVRALRTALSARQQGASEQEEDVEAMRFVSVSLAEHTFCPHDVPPQTRTQVQQHVYVRVFQLCSIYIHICSRACAYFHWLTVLLRYA